jgi:hypothetical protein
MTLSQKSTLKRSPFIRKEPMGKLGLVASPKKKAPAKRSKMKTKQRARTSEDIALHDRLATLGCIACIKDGRFNPYVSIHHVDGRTKPDCHKLVLPLCAPHHQRDDTDPLHRVAVHPDKARFEARYGTQEELMDICAKLLERQK